MNIELTRRKLLFFKNLQRHANTKPISELGTQAIFRNWFVGVKSFWCL